MTAHSGVTPEEKIVAAILEEAQTQAQAIITAAEDAAKTELEAATREAERAAAEIRDQAERDAARLAAQSLAGARLDARRLLLRAREDALELVLNGVEESLKALRTDTTRYRQALQHLLAEAVAGLDCDHVVVSLGVGDKAVADPEFLDQVRKAVSDNHGREVVIEVRFNEKDMGGGCLAMTEDGRVRFDNTVPRRLFESKKLLKGTIMAEVAQP